MSLTKKPQILTPPPPAGVVQEQVETPSPVPVANAPEVMAAKERARRKSSVRQGLTSTILTSAQGLPSAGTSLTPIGSTLLGS